MKAVKFLTMVSAVALIQGAALADDKVVKIGVLTDMSGPYVDIGGPNAVLATEMAIEDSGLKAKGWTIEVVSADHQNKPDVGTSVARQWLDVDHVDMINDLPNSGVALAVSAVVKEKNGVFLNTGSASSELTNKQCTPNTIHWVYDTYALATSTGKAVTKNGGDSWFFITADYAFGKQLEADTSAVVTANGGKIVGSVRAPLNNADFSSFLLQAQASKAKIVGLANAGADTVNSVKQAHEFGLVEGGQQLASLLLFATDVHALGLNVAQGLTLTNTFYWDLNDGTRAWSKKYQERAKGHNMPAMTQAGDYSATLHYLKALEALGGNPHDGAKVVAKMKELPTDDPLFGKGTIRADGRKMHPVYLMQVKKPAESKGEWDIYKTVSTLTADEAFRPLAASECPLVKK